MSLELRNWPRYDSPGEALRQEAQAWRPERLKNAQTRFDSLDLELGSSVTRLAIGIVDANERPDQFAMHNVYSEQFTDNTSGAILLVNYDAETPPERTEELVDTIQRRRDEAGVAISIVVAGYNKRKFGELKRDAWDIAVIHGLRHNIETPIAGVSNDIDMPSASAVYWDLMTKNEHVEQPARAWSSKAKPELFGDPDCAVNKHIRYLFAMRTLMTRVTGKPLIYGASTATSLDTYAAAGEGWTGDFSSTLHDGVGEPTQLILNIAGRATGKPILNPKAQDKIDTAILTHAHAVPEEAFVRVSARRETVEHAIFLSGNPYPMELTDTSVNNSYRRLSPDELASLAENTKGSDARVLEEITRLETNFRKRFKGEKLVELADAFRAAREEIGLPEPDADSIPALPIV